MHQLKKLLLFFFLSPYVFAETPPVFNLLSAPKDLFPASSKVNIINDPVYKTSKQYLAYPLTSIVNKLASQTEKPLKNSVLIFTAADGYVVTMAYQDALLEKGFIAFKDLSANQKTWTEFKFGNEIITPAPYYLVWKNPNLDKWRYPSPFQLTSISIDSADSYYSQALPTNNNAQAMAGFNLFSRYCIRCHSINNTGGKLGPELNLPNNVTSLYTEEYLTHFILNATKFNASTKMPVFQDIISKKDTLTIQYYLKSLKTKLNP